MFFLLLGWMKKFCNLNILNFLNLFDFSQFFKISFKLKSKKG